MPSHRQPPPPPAPELTIAIEVEPATDVSDELPGREDRRFVVPGWLHRFRPLWRRRRIALLLAILVLAVVAVWSGALPTGVARSADTSATGPVLPAGSGAVAGGLAPNATPTRPVYRTLVAPASAHPGQTLTLIGYQRRGICAATMVYVDVSLVGHDVLAVVDEAQPDWDGVVLSVRVPEDITPGIHLVTLVGALPGPGRGAEVCGDARQHTGVISTALVNVQPAN